MPLCTITRLGLVIVMSFALVGAVDCCVSGDISVSPGRFSDPAHRTLP